MKIDPRRSTVYVYRDDPNVYLAPKSPPPSPSRMVGSIIAFYVSVAAFVATASGVLLLAMRMVTP